MILSYLKSKPSNLSNCKISGKNKNTIKNALFGYFWAGILQKYCHIWNRQLRICLIAKFCEETKMTTLGIKNAISWVFFTKNVLFEYFWARILKNYCQIWNQHTWICLIAKYCEIMKMPKNLGPKVPYLGIFGLEF